MSMDKYLMDMVDEEVCYRCLQMGHIVSECPWSSDRTRAETSWSGAGTSSEGRSTLYSSPESHSDPTAPTALDAAEAKSRAGSWPYSGATGISGDNRREVVSQISLNAAQARSKAESWPYSGATGISAENRREVVSPISLNAAPARSNAESWSYSGATGISAENRREAVSPISLNAAEARSRAESWPYSGTTGIPAENRRDVASPISKTTSPETSDREDFLLKTFRECMQTILSERDFAMLGSNTSRNRSYSDTVANRDRDCTMDRKVPAEPIRKTPDQLYICNICEKSGHDIKDCPDARPLGERLTPYQGTKRVFGYFKCQRCRRCWSSGNSWANTTQMCKKCRMPVFPYKQTAISKVEDDEAQKTHREDLCEKCRRLGYYCGIKKNQ